jgi:autotransporter-associated beta strand protein
MTGALPRLNRITQTPPIDPQAKSGAWMIGPNHCLNAFGMAKQLTKLMAPIALTGAMLGFAANPNPVQAQSVFAGFFAGYYAPANWTQTITGNGSINTSAAPTSITLLGTDGLNGNSNTDFTITAPYTGPTYFTWSYQTQDRDGPSYDPFGFLLNGVFTQLSVNTGSNKQSGTANFFLNIGDVFGFRQNSTDSTLGLAFTTISGIGIVPGLPAIATVPYSTTFAGGTLLVDAPGTYTQNWLLLNIPGNSIDLGGVASTFSGGISGEGGINFINSGQGGRLELNGANTYSGSTTIQNGAHVAVNSSIASSSGLTVLGGGKISGTGVLPTTAIASRGIIAPGNSIGTLSVNGDFAFQDGIYELEVQGPRSDNVAVSGNVTAFHGTVRLLSFGGGTAFPGFTYVALTAPNSGAFANSGSLNLDASGLPPSVVLGSGTTLVQNSSGNPNQLDLQFRPRDPAGAVTAAVKATGAGNSNTLQSASVFDSAFRRLATANAGNANASGSAIGSTGFTTGQAAAAGITPGFLQVQASLLALTSPEQLNVAVQSIVPENYAAFQAVALNALQSQRELLFSQADSCPTNGWVLADPTTGTTSRQPICVFATGGNTTSSITGSNGLSSYNSALAGGLYGLEWKTAPAWTIGAAYGYGTANLDNLGVAANSVHSVVNSGSLYGVYKPATNWSIKGLFAYSNFNIDGQRNSPFLGNGSPITGNTTGQGFTTGVRAEMNMSLNAASSSLPLTLKPMLGLAYGAYQQGSFNEAGNDSLQLNVSQHSAQSLEGSLGAELSSRIVLDAKANNAFVPKLTLAYQVDALANDSSNYSLDAFLPAAGSGFTTIGQSYGANNLLVGGSVEVQIANKAALFAGVNYQVFNSGNQFSYGGGLKVQF